MNKNEGARCSVTCRWQAVGDSSTPSGFVLGCLILAPGVAGPVAILVKRKENPLRWPTMLLVGGLDCCFHFSPVPYSYLA